MKTQKMSTQKLTKLGMLAAILLIMALTPLGYLKVGPFSITFLTIPVAIGAIILGPSEGAVLGFLFGITSLIQCFGADAFGTLLFSVNPINTVILCIIPRILTGYFSGLTFRFLKENISLIFSYAISAFVAAATNTILFVGFLIVLFNNTEAIKTLGDNIIKVISVLITTNSLVEAVVTTLLVTIISKACSDAVAKRRK